MAEPTAQLGDNFGALGGFVGGLAQGGLDRAQARAIDAHGAQQSAVANEREDQIRREARQQIGEQVAATAQSGIGFTQTTNDSIAQSEANASLDALNARYAGLVARTDDMNKAAALRHHAAIAPFTGAITGAAKALSHVSGYGMGG